MTLRILVVEDDPDIASGLVRGFALHGYEAVWEEHFDMALARFGEAGFDAATVDVMLGTDSGIELVRLARLAGFRRPILMLSSLSDVEDRARGIEAGADDYIVKPYSFAELFARLQVQARRQRKPVFDRAARTVQGRDTRIELTEREARLLGVLLENEGRTLSRGVLFDTLWAGEGTSSENVVDVYIGYLRRKLSPPEAFGIDIQTIRNRGFVLIRR
jgi:DNA-binding response OmpR family regulator